MILLILSCGNVLGTNDPAVYMEPQYLMGTWYEVKLVPADVSGTWKIDTTRYTITDLTQTQRDHLLQISGYAYIKDPLTYDITYSKGGSLLGYIYDPQKNEWDDTTQRACIIYKIVQDYDRTKTYSEIRFEMPNLDSLFVTIGTQKLGLKKDR
jgi:hypothetical protein